ncbi:hypothetical protein H8959_004469 [Pygathrix nigripes]
MSRRSSRLQAKQQPQPSQTESPQEVQIIQAKKRKTTQDVKKRREEVTKKHQYEIRNCWPPVLSGGISPCIIIETPHKEIGTSDFSRFTNYRFKNLFINPSPLPDLSHFLGATDTQDNFLDQNPDLLACSPMWETPNPLMILILLWSANTDLLAKLHEALKWELCPVTIISWLNLFLQVDALKDAPKVLLPQYSQETFIQIAQLLDLCILAIDSLEFQYRILTAAALCHFTSIEVVKKASGLEWDSISECVDWMVPFVNVVKSTSPVKLKTFKKIPMEDRHNIQTHTNYLAMLVCFFMSFLALLSESSK